MLNLFRRRTVVIAMSGVMVLLTCRIYLLPPILLEPNSAKALTGLTTGEMTPVGGFSNGRSSPKATTGLVIEGLAHTSGYTGTVRAASPETEGAGGKDRTSVRVTSEATTATTTYTAKEVSTTTTTSSTPQASTAVTYIDSKKDTFLLTFEKECQKIKIPPDLIAKDKQCPCVPDKLVGRRLPGSSVPTWQELEAEHPDMEEGGHWKPSSCAARQRACFFLPYRDRQDHLMRWLKVMVPFMKKQNSDFRIFITEQSNGSRFNRGMLVNAGVAHVQKEGIHCDCIIIHDVDHVPEDDRNMYFCQDKPIHLAVARNDQKYKLPYASFVGGVIAATHDAYKRINGFSNLYFGWGSEDDDINERFKGVGLRMKRYRTPISFYTMFKHVHAVENKGRWKLVKAWKSRWKTDGLGDVMDQCAISKVEKKKLVTFLHVDIDEKAVVERSKANAPQEVAAKPKK